MTCQDLTAQLDAFVDEQLGPREAQAIAVHLAECPNCARLVADRRGLAETVRAAWPKLAVPGQLAASVKAALDEAPPEVSRLRPERWGWLAMAAALIVAVGGTWQVANQRAAAERLRGDLVASHVRSLMPGHLIDVASADQHTVKPWFNGKLDFSPPVPNLTSEGYPLLGGRMDYVGGRPVAVIVYGRRQHLIDLFVWPAESSTVGSSFDRQGYHLISWADGGNAFWAASDLNAGELGEFVRLAREVGRSGRPTP